MDTVDRIIGQIDSKGLDELGITSPEGVFHFASYKGKRIPEAEHVLLRDHYFACLYACDIIKGPWPEAEDIIAKDPHSAYTYSRWALKAPWPKGEAAMAKDPDVAMQYAYTLKGRFRQGEKAIVKDAVQREKYMRLFPEVKDEWASSGLIDWLDT